MIQRIVGPVMFRSQGVMERVTISDYDLQAYVDNELDWERAKAVVACLDQDPALRKRYNELKKQKQLLGEWWDGAKIN